MNMLLSVLVCAVLGAAPSGDQVRDFISAIGKKFPTWSYKEIRDAAQEYFPYSDIPESVRSILKKERGCISEDTSTAAPVILSPKEINRAVFDIADADPSLTCEEISQAFARLYQHQPCAPSVSAVQSLLYYRNMRKEAGEASMDSDEEESSVKRVGGDKRRSLSRLALRIMKEEILNTGGVDTASSAVIPTVARRFKCESGGYTMKYSSLAHYHGRARKQLIEEDKGSF